MELPKIKKKIGNYRKMHGEQDDCCALTWHRGGIRVCLYFLLLFIKGNLLRPRK